VNAFCDVKGLGDNGFPRFWQVKAGDVVNMKCTGNTCVLEDCCDLGLKRRCTKADKEGLNAEGFTKDKCGWGWTLKSDLYKIACTGNDGRTCKKRDCCDKTTSSPTSSLTTSSPT